MNRRGFLSLLGLAPAAAVVRVVQPSLARAGSAPISYVTGIAGEEAAGTALPSAAVVTTIGIDGGSNKTTLTAVQIALREAERAKWRAFGVLDANDRFSPELFGAYYRKQRAERAAENQLVSADTPSAFAQPLPSLLQRQMCAQASPSEQPRGDS